MAGCEMVDDPQSGRFDIARHCAWEAWKARASVAAPAAGDARKPDFARAEQVIQDYVAIYEMCGEDRDGRDAIHTPTEGERALIIDAIHGLMAEPEFVAALSASQQQEG